MPTTRQQSKAKSTSTPSSTTETKRTKKPISKKETVLMDNGNADTGKKPTSKANKKEPGEKRDMEQVVPDSNEDKNQPPAKKQKTEEYVYTTGVIERGHIYFFYRPRVQVEEVNSIDEVRSLHMLLIPRPPDFAVSSENAETNSGIKDKQDPETVKDFEMKFLEPGADAKPAPALTQKKQKYRIITVGKKRLPDPEKGRRKETFWATVTALGDDLSELAKGLGEKTYETKTRGIRHEGSNRIVGRGAYAIVNKEARTPSQRETHLGYHLSHPPTNEMGSVQEELGIFTASSFIIQIKNPRAPATGSQPVRSKGATYPDQLMHSVFGAATSESNGESTRGREEYGLKFASCETPELLDYLNTELLMIAARSGEQGLEESLGEGRGEALSEIEDKEGKESINQIFRELGVEAEKYPAQPLEGHWI